MQKQPKSRTFATFQVAKVESLDFLTLDEQVIPNRYPVRKESLSDAGWSLSKESAEALMNKLRTAGIPLGYYVNKQMYMGIKTGLNEAFVIDSGIRNALILKDPNSSDFIKPFLTGGDIKRYEPVRSDKYLILIPNGWTNAHRDKDQDAWEWFQNKLPAIAGYLAGFAEAAQRRLDKGDYWWELRPCDYYAEFEKPKIMFPDISQRGNFTIDESKHFSGNTTYFIISSEKYLLAILNSKLLTFLYTSVFAAYRGGYLRFFSQYVSQLPIRTINFDDPADKARHDSLVAMVERMLALKQEHAAAADALNERRHELAQEIERLDHAIDRVVYDLYGLTEDEISVVEGKA